MPTGTPTSRNGTVFPAALGSGRDGPWQGCGLRWLVGPSAALSAAQSPKGAATGKCHVSFRVLSFRVLSWRVLSSHVMLWRVMS